MMNWLLPPIADAGEIIGVVVMLCMILFGIMAKLLEKGKAENPPPVGRPPMRPGAGPMGAPQGRFPPQNRPAMGMPPRPVPPAVAAEIEAFRRGQQAAGGALAGGAASGPVIAQAVPMRDEVVAQRVDQTLGSELSTLATTATPLGGLRAAQTPLSTLHTGSPLGDLRSGEATDAPSEELVVSPVTARLIETLRHPEGVQNAILLSEILQRPEHRWSRTS